jgi:molybdate transport system ATP-binding protein
LDTRAELHRHLAAHPGATLLITHDPLDALVLADRLVIVEDGHVVQEGDAATITVHPVPTTSPASSASTSTVATPPATRSRSATASPSPSPTVSTETPSSPSRPRPSRCTGTSPTAAHATAGRPPSPASNATATTWRVQLSGPIGMAADVTPAAAAYLHLERGQPVWAAVKATETRAYPAGGVDRAAS